MLTEKLYNFPIKTISELAKKEGNSKKPVYEIHKWWARRLSPVVRSLLLLHNNKYNTKQDFLECFYKKNNLDITVMDIFMGGGSTLVEAKKMGARTIGIDIDPMACFVTHKELEVVDTSKLQKEFESLKNKIGNELSQYYMTKTKNGLCKSIYYFWVYHVSCPSCNHAFDSHPHYRLAHSKISQDVFCKACGSMANIPINDKSFACKKCKSNTVIDDGVLTRGICTCPNCSTKFPMRDKLDGTTSLKPFAVEYQNSDGTRAFKSFDKFDQKQLSVAEHDFDAIQNELPLPRHAKINTTNEKDGRPMTHGYHKYVDLFNKRQLLCLGLLLKEILAIKKENKEWFLIAFSDMLLANNMLCSYAFGYRKLTPLFGIHAYTVPARPVENNVWGTGGVGRGSFEKVFHKMIKAKQYCKEPYETIIESRGQVKKVTTGEKIESIVTNSPSKFYSGNADSLILNQSSESMKMIKDNSVDLILTDPPYYDNLNYSHLADFFYQWIKEYMPYRPKKCQIENTIYAVDDSESTFNNMSQRLTKVFGEAIKKLKDDGELIFSYHHNKPNAWKVIGEALKNAGFVVNRTIPIRSEGQSAYHSSVNSIKWDSIVIATKKKQLSSIDSKAKLQELTLYWLNYIHNNNLDLNHADILSFVRSLAIQVYTQSVKSNLSLLMEHADKLIEDYSDGTLIWQLTNLPSSNVCCNRGDAITLGQYSFENSYRCDASSAAL